MIISSNVLLDMSSGADRRTILSGDSSPELAPTIVPTIETLTKTVIGNFNDTLQADTSFILSRLRAVAASAAASAETMITLPKGLYTLDFTITGRFVGVSVAGGATPDAWMDIVNSALTVNALIVSLYAATTLSQFSVSRRIRIAPTETVLVRARNAATGVGQTMDLHFGLSVERHL